MQKDKLLQVLNGSKLYVTEKHYSLLLQRYVDVEYSVVINNFKNILNHINYQNKSVEEILELSTDYLNSLLK